MVIDVANKFVIDDTAGITAFHMLVLEASIWITSSLLYIVNTCLPFSPYFYSYIHCSFVGTIVTRLDLLP